MQKRFLAVKAFESGESLHTAARKGGTTVDTLRGYLRMPIACASHGEVIGVKDKTIHNLVTIIDHLGVEKQLTKRLKEVNSNDLAKAMLTYTEWILNILESRGNKSE